MFRRLLLILFFACTLSSQATAQVSRPPYRYQSRDSVRTYPSGRYQPISFLHNWLMGKNYRKVWSQPVTLPVFRLSETEFKVLELGGGMQTKSLKLEDKEGQQWSLRTIDKDVQGAFKGFMKHTFVKNIAQDHVSAAMPYAPLVVAALLKKTDVTAADPMIYFVADDPALGEYRSIFANTVCMLENRDLDYKDTDNTKTMLRNLQESNRYVVSQRILLEARLFDMLIADWDRHYDNWRWGQVDSAGLEVYYPIPRDRDWAFYHSNGFVPELARLAALRFLVDFDKNPDYIKNLSLKAWALDGAFLNEMDQEDWLVALSSLQQSLNDQVIEKAVKKLPPEIFTLVGDSFITRLKWRRDKLEKGMMDYYSYLARNVQVDGSNDIDIFSFKPAEDGLLLQVYRLPKGREATRQKIYERRFLDKETFTIMLNGLGSDDVFEIDENVRSSIRLTLNGGTGKDTYDLKGNVRSLVNEHRAEKTEVRNKSGAKISFH